MKSPSHSVQLMRPVVAIRVQSNYSDEDLTKKPILQAQIREDEEGEGRTVEKYDQAAALLMIEDEIGTEVTAETIPSRPKKFRMFKKKLCARNETTKASPTRLQPSNSAQVSKSSEEPARKFQESKADSSFSGKVSVDKTSETATMSQSLPNLGRFGSAANAEMLDDDSEKEDLPR